MLPIWFIFYGSSLVALASLSSGRCQAPPATRSLNFIYLFVFCLYFVQKLFRDDIDIDLSFQQAVSAVEVGPVSPKMWDIRFAAAERSLTETFRLGFVVANIVVQNRKQQEKTSIHMMSHMIFIIVCDVVVISCDYSETTSSNFLRTIFLVAEITAKPANLPAKIRGRSRTAVSCTASQSEPQAGRNGSREKFSDPKNVVTVIVLKVYHRNFHK